MSAISDAAAAERPARTMATMTNRRRWAILILLALGGVIAYVDRTSISEVLADHSFRQHLGLTDVDRGMLASAFFWSYAVLQIPMGWLVDRFGVKRPYTIMFLIWCLASAGTGLMSSFAGLLLMRIFTGMGEAIVGPATYRWIRLNFKDESGGTAVGLYLLGTKLGPAIGAPLAAWLIVMHDWRFMFLITGFAGLLWLIPWVFLATNDRAAYAEAAAKKRAAAEANKRRVPFGRILRALLSSPVVWGSIICSFCYFYFIFYSMTWMPAYLVEQHGLSLRKSGFYTFFSFLGVAFVALAAGWLADRIVRRGWDAVLVRKSFVVAGFVLAATELFGGYSTSVHAAVFWNILSLSGIGLVSANNLALCRLTLIPTPAVGLVTALQDLAVSFAGIITPIFSGWLLQESGSYDAPMKVIFIFLLVAAGSCIVLYRRKWAPVIDENPA